MRDREVLLMLLLVDLLLLNLSFVIVAYVHYGITYAHFDIIRATFLLLNLSWVLIYLFFISDNPLERAPFTEKLKTHTIKLAAFLSTASVLALALNIDEISRITFFSTIAYFYLFRLVTTQFILRYLKIKKQNKYNYSRSLEAFFDKNPEYGEVIGYLDDNIPSTSNSKILGKIDDFQEVFDKTSFDQVIIALPMVNKTKILKLVDTAEYNGVRPRMIPDYYGLFQRNFEMEKLGDIPIVNIREFPLAKFANRFWKRAFDIIFSLVALVLVSPIMLLIAIAIKLDSRGPIFYLPVRLGRRGEEFSLYKFRSMRHHPDTELGDSSTMKEDPRVTRVGRIIRKFSLDELPQFINVLLYHMSVVGPRPHRVVLNKMLQEKTSNYLVRHYILPGITGWAQVCGWRGPTETRLQSSARTLHDLWYIEHWTFPLDIYIIILTIFGKKARKNAY